MNLNLIGYAIYLLITIVIIINVGRICYQNGNVYVAQLDIVTGKQIGRAHV